MRHGILFVVVALATLAGSPTNASTGTYEQRTQYKAALADLSAGRISAFNRKRSALEGYALVPYLEYRYALRHISRQSLEDLEALREKYPDLAAHRYLRRAYLRQAARRGAASRFLKAYDPQDSGLPTAERCFHARALHAVGRKAEAFEAAEQLWLVGRSQDKACDPIFDAWRGSDSFTEEVAWRRLQLAVEANQRQLARYLSGFLKGSLADRAEALMAVHANPNLIARTGSYKIDTTAGRYVIQHGLNRLRRKNPQRAYDAWLSYRAALSFSAAETAAIEGVVLAELAEEDGVFPPPEHRSEDPAVLEALARAAVLQGNFAQIERYVEQMPDELRHKLEWQYWLARALQHNHGENERAALALRSLAGERHYYGFLAADRIGSPPTMIDASEPADERVISALASIPAVARAIELLAVGDRTNAMREWNVALSRASTQKERRLLGYVALHLGELRLAISTANRADLNDEVALRFPVAYLQQFRTAAVETGLPIPLLMAVTRQESAFDRRARSSADARGLMQLLPSTARTVATRLRESAPSTTLLYQADTNVRLGAHYLAWLSNRFDAQIPLMTAAYNAGEHRVDRWIKDQEGVAMDLWIERIPFRETRNYVKNVLAFQQVYSQLLSAPQSPTLRNHEQAVVGR